MIQFNLLPDVKVAYIKAKKAKRVVIVISGLSVAVSLVLLVLMVSAVAFQNKHISDLDSDIKSNESSIDSIQDLAKILTIQNQLKSLPALYSQRPVTSRLYKYVQATTPTQISIAELELKLDTSTLKIEGTADSLESVNRYVDTLKFTKFSVDDSKDKANAFTGVVLTDFSRDTKAASYTISFSFSPDIFDGAKKITLDVPKTITTRSETELPGTNGVFDSKGTN